MRIVVLMVALLFIALIAVLTVIEIARNGLTPLDLAAALVLVLFMVGIIGALRQPPDSD